MPLLSVDKVFSSCTVAIDLYSYSVHYYFVGKENGTSRFYKIRIKCQFKTLFMNVVK